MASELQTMPIVRVCALKDMQSVPGQERMRYWI